MTEALHILTYAIAVIAWLCIALPTIATPGWQDDEGFHAFADGFFNSFHNGSF